MSMIIKLILFLFIAYPIPYLLGLLFAHFSKDANYSLSKNLLFGYMLIWSILQITAIPAIYLKMKFSIYAYIIYAIILIGVFVSIFLNRKAFKNIILKKISWLKTRPWLPLIVLFLIIIQTVYLSLANLGDHDDSFYVATAETALETNTLMEYNPYTGDLYQSVPSRYVLSPFPVFVALISNILNIRAATTAHTLLALILIPLAYTVWYLIGNIFFKNNTSKTSVFMLIVMCILVYSGYSVYNQGMFMHIRIWQGKAVLTAIILPFIFYQGLCISQKVMTTYKWILLFLSMFASCFVSSMGIMLAAIMLGVIALTDAFLNKSIRNWKNIILCCIPNILFAFIYIFIR